MVRSREGAIDVVCDPALVCVCLAAQQPVAFFENLSGTV